VEVEGGAAAAAGGGAGEDEGEGVEAWVVAATGAEVAGLVAGRGTTTTLLVTTGAAAWVVDAGGVRTAPASVEPLLAVLPMLARLELTVLVRAATASGVQELGPVDQPVSLFAMSEA
jgi:hypothetical protein